MIWDSANVRKVNIAPYRKRYGSQINAGVEVTSNHLTPVYHMGDILLISRRPPRDGDTTIFLNTENGRAYLRRLFSRFPVFFSQSTDMANHSILIPIMKMK